MKWSRFQWAGHNGSVEEKRICTGFWWGNVRDEDHLGDLAIDGIIVSHDRNCICERYVKDYPTIVAVGKKYHIFRVCICGLRHTAWKVPSATRLAVANFCT
jgi:hypothetical protein